MTMPMTQKKVIAWVMVKKQRIKFKEEETPHVIADSAMQYVANAEGIQIIKNGDSVDVGFGKVERVEDGKTTSDENGVTFIQLSTVKAQEAQNQPVEAPKQENVVEPTKEEEKPTAVNSDETKPTVEERIWTVAGRALKQKPYVMIFEEAPKKPDGKVIWYVVPTELEAVLNTIQKGNKVKFSFQIVDNKNIITSMQKMETAKQEETISTPTAQPQTNNDYKNTTNDSIVRQVSLKFSQELISKAIEIGKIDINEIQKIEELTQKLTKIAFNAINQ